MNVDVFYKFPTDLMRSSGFIDQSTGEIVKLTPLAKNVYTYMLSRNQFFTERLSGDHYETQQTIADACGSEYQVVGKVLRLLIKHGVLDAVKLRPNGVGQWRWFYRKVRTDLVLRYGDKGEKESKIVVDSDPLIVQNTHGFTDCGVPECVPEYSDEFLMGIVFEEN